MAMISSAERTTPTFFEHESGVPIRCRKAASDSEIIELLDRCDEGVLSTPDLRSNSAVAKTIARRLRTVRFQLANPSDDWRVGAEDDFSLAAERLDAMLQHGRELYLGSVQRIDREGATRDLALIGIVDCHAPARDIVVDLQRL